MNYECCFGASKAEIFDQVGRGGGIHRLKWEKENACYVFDKRPQKRSCTF